MLDLPEPLAQLKTPSFIHGNPVWLQMTVMVGGGLMLPLAGLSWIVVEAMAGRADGGHWALGGIAALLLGAGLYPRNWRRWVNLAADRDGVYIGTWAGRYHFVPWRDVGPSSIGVAGIGSNRQRTVILMLRVDDDTWGDLLGGRKRRVNAPADADGFRPFGIGNAARDVAATQQALEAMRRSADAMD